jgi:sortase A
LESKNINTKEYSLSIPKLNIVRAKVVVGGEDLSRSLVHYLPKSLPGEYGNVAIFGHSTLPQLYNVTDYKTIFTYLPSLEKNDMIMVQLGDLEYEYQITDMFVVMPDKVSVLEQKYDASYLTLVTCVPPGTFWKRLVVRAKLVQLP